MQADVTRHADIRAAGRNSPALSSSPTIMIPDGPGMDLGEHQMMLMMDPPRHGAFRRLMIPDFVPNAVARMQHRVAGLATRIIDNVCERGSCDLVADIAGEMPSFVVADMLGLPLDDGRELYKLTEIIHSAPETLPDGAGADAVMRMFAYSQGVWADRKANPGEDLSSRLVHAQVEGRAFDEIDFALMFLLLVDAGGDTTRNLVAGGLNALFSHHAEFDALKNNFDVLIPTAMEELLRWVSPVTYMRRTATTELTIGDTHIAEGDKVVMYYGSANRDESVFDDPYRLDLTRTPNDHQAFGGGGPHFCLGAHLARAEAHALLRELLTRMPDIAPEGPTKWLASTFISGPQHLPITFTPSAPTSP